MDWALGVDRTRDFPLTFAEIVAVREWGRGKKRKLAGARAHAGEIQYYLDLVNLNTIAPAVEQR
jgi:hypothetical protein